MGGLPDPGYGALINRLANPPNPLTTLGQDAQALSAARQFQADQAGAEAMRAATDPVTGQVDIGRANALMSQGPGAWHMGQWMHDLGGGVGAQAQGTSADVAAKQAQVDAAGRLMFPLLRDGAATQSIDPAAVQQQLDIAHNARLMTDQQYSAWSGQLKGMNPQQAYAFVIGANEGNEGARQLYGGSVASVGQGPNQRFIQQQPQGVQPTTPSVPIGLTPGQNVDVTKWLTEQTSWPDPNDPTKTNYGTQADRIKQLFPGVDIGKLISSPSTGGEPTPAPTAAPLPPTAPGSGGGSNREIATNNFAGMRNPNVPAVGGPNTNPSGWQQFLTPEAGVQAISNQLDRYHSGATTGTPITTLRGIVSTWAPASDGNPTPTLIARASQIVGVDPDKPLNWDDPALKPKLVEAMIRNEQGGNLPGAAAAAIPKVFSGGAGESRNINAPTPPVGSTLVPGGGVQVPPPNIQLADFPSGRVGQMPITLPETTKASAQQYTTDLGSYTQLPQRLAPLQQAADVLRANPNLGTGTGAGDIQRLASLAQNFGFTLSPSANTNLAAFTELNKDLERYYLGLPGGQRSDLAQAETKMSQPSTEMQRQALEDLIPKTIGLERANSAGYLNFLQQHGEQNAPLYAGQYQAQAAAYRNTLDPVAFGFDYMTPQQRAAYRDSLSTQAKQRYYYSLKEASRLYNIPLQ